MKNQLKKLSFPLLLSSTILLTACGGGGGGSTPATGGGATNTGVSFNGNTSPAAIDASNTGAIGKAAGESIQVASASTGLPTGVNITGNSVDMDEINAIVIANSGTLSLPSAAEIPGVCSNSGGSASVTFEPEGATSGPVKSTITYNNCDVGSRTGTSINGTATINYDDLGNLDAGFSIKYDNFKITDNGRITTINMTMDCPGGTAGCTFSSDFIGADGVTHRVSSFSITEGSSGFGGTATFFHGKYGSVEITATAITYGSCGSYPDGGTISFTSTDSSANVTFNSDCTISGDWTNSAGSGTF